MTRRQEPVEGALEGMPHGIAASWGIAAEGQRGPKRELSLERITEAAIAIADDEGLESVSMSKVATALGYTPMSLYRYVTGKDDLLQLMFDAASDVPLASTEGTWREQLTHWAAVVRAGYRAHPWLAAIPPSATPTTPNRIAIVEAGLHAMRSLHAPGPIKLSVTLLLLGYVAMYQTASRDSVDPAVRSALRMLIDVESYPELAPLVADGVFDEPIVDSDSTFYFGFQRFLDGIEAWMHAEGHVDDPAPDLPAAIVRDGGVRAAQKAVREAEERLRAAQAKASQAIAKVADRERKAAEKIAAKEEKKRQKG
ncbi:TetR/AcrR family transcriptional regulator C-terminal domain-containing protein [Agrococcus casei]|uniref:TetR/AcrR family transcriptional regulator n=1 Tax=Agrococcus casei TaxID=343512 RepID=UPI003F8F7A32